MTVSPTPAELPSRAYPDYRCLYIIVAGIMIGVMLGPVLRVTRPDLYDRLFVGAGEIDRQIQKNNAEILAKCEALKAAGASDAAIDELMCANEPGQMLLKAKAGEAGKRHTLWLLGRTTALSIAVIFIMVVETLVDPENVRVRGRLVIARYLWIAAWLAMVIAQAWMLESFPLIFFLALVGGSLAFALFPYPPKAGAGAEQGTQEAKT